ncbi:uncharacterized mitochondrial protein AtMg00810-like [Humulus lupulus]|uniref:uncharacterized mitochondrial protein AtMg00810-like n=1 Tax=Humulus lupulus TaxID=3486 RepID=UPI002B405F3C|nr:uncharacterized mitochondrial protein AtMg00810-like [Humulus lupulus]
MDLLSQSGMLDSKPISTPLALTSLSVHDGTPLSDATQYRSTLGALQYCTMMGPDISHVVNHLCQFMHALIESHMLAVKRVLRYLKGTTLLGLTVHANSAHSFNCYTNADWASCRMIDAAQALIACFLATT